jgi:hypothetical protein
VDDGITPGSGAAASGVGITTDCEHWRREAEDPDGEGYEPNKLKSAFENAKVCYKCKHEQDKREEMLESAVDSEEAADVFVDLDADLNGSEQQDNEFFTEMVSKATIKEKAKHATRPCKHPKESNNMLDHDGKFNRKLVKTDYDSEYVPPKALDPKDFN